MTNLLKRERRNKDNTFGWIGSISGISGGALFALNLPYSKYAYWILIASSISWIIQGYRNRDNSIILMNTAFSLINAIGIYFWII